jgi:glycerophosphoryl diester phosphodiesterase
MAAFKLAHKMKADMIELDVQLSRDGVPVVFHDAKLDQHSNGKGPVSSFLWDELRQLDAGNWFSLEFKGEKIPSLQEVLEWASGKMLVNIEIKTEAVGENLENGIEKKVIELVQKEGMEKNVIISSFDYRALVRIKKMAPEIFTGLLYHKKSSGRRGPIKLLKDYGADYFHCSKSEMSKKWRAQLNDDGKRYLIYTVNKKKQMKKWIEMGVYGIFSDKPDLLREVTDQYISKSA